MWRFRPDWSTIPPLWRNVHANPKRGASSNVTGARKRGSSRKSAKDGKLPKEAVTLVVLLKAREGQEPLLEAELRALVGPTREEDGCITYDLHRGADSPSSYMLHEVWESREAHRLHTQTPHFIRWNARKDALLAGRIRPFGRRLFEVGRREATGELVDEVGAEILRRILIGCAERGV